ncbi:hypersensitive response-inducing protein [Annulohypoxylon truncatum]|uniref:hypersensitive response-inducing protein n=1 Tax=Annulohypoxylon truncatum TaxID=327061 RepID=UPI002007CA02|nr:hypersensitive response-inducing protein [Annulohypoxylon truncatum]KAI1211044.1 hypersensitive response-inducing protein [Annulohypoxylon truncatum]
MQFFAVAAFVAAASASTVFTVSDFSAGCIPHSTQCSYNFGVIQAGNGETTPVACSAMVAANTDGSLPEVKAGTCKDSARTFTVTKGADGLTLTVTQPITPSSNQSGSHLLANSDLKTSNAPNAEVQSYAGPTGFDLTS